MGNKGNRTPVALVVGSAGGKTYAIALKDANSSCQWAVNNAYRNRNIDGNFNNFIGKYTGYDCTYSPIETTNPSSVIKALDDRFPAFKAIATYDSGVTLQGSIQNAKWYMPGLSEWEMTMQTIQAGTLKQRTLKGIYNYTGPLLNKLQRILFEQAGGNALDGFYWSADTGGQPYTIVIRKAGTTTQISVANKNDGTAAARSFIQF